MSTVNPYVPPSLAASAGSMPLARFSPAALWQKNRFGVLCFWLIVLVNFINMNALTFKTLGWWRVFSIGIGVLCLAALVSFRFTFPRDLGRAGRIFMFFLASYLVIGTLSGFEGDVLDALDRGFAMTLVSSSFLLIATCAVAGRHLIVAYPIPSTFRWLYIVGMLAVGTIFLGMYLPGMHKFLEYKARNAGVFANPNQAGMVAASAAAMGFAALITDKRKMLILVGLAIIGVATVLTYSRSSIIALILLGLVQVMVSPVIKNKSILLAALILLGGFGWFLLEGIQSTKGLSLEHQKRLGSISSVLHGDLSAENTGGRLSLAAAGLRKWVQRPFFGHGLGSMYRLPDTRKNIGPHNEFVFILGESGVVPAALFIAMFVLLAREAWRCKIKPVRTFVLGYLTVFLMYCLTSHNVLTDRPHNIMLGLCCGFLVGARHLQQTTQGHASALRHR